MPFPFSVLREGDDDTSYSPTEKNGGKGHVRV